MTNASELETVRQLVATAARQSERAAEKGDRNEIAIRDLQQDVQRNGTRLDRVERQLSQFRTETNQRIDSMQERLDSMQAGIERIEAIVLRLLPGTDET